MRKGDAAGLGARILLTALLAAGCQSVGVRSIPPGKGYPQAQIGGLDAKRLSEQSRQVLRRLDLDLREDQAIAAGLAAEIEARSPSAERDALLFAGAEWALHRASRARSETETQRQAHLLAAAYAYELLERPSSSVHADAAKNIYRRATGEIARQGRAADLEVMHGEGLLDPEDFDQLLPADTFETQGLRHRHRASGMGAPLIAVRENRQARPIERFMPPEGILNPATAMLFFDDGDPSKAQLALYDPREVQTVTREGRSWPLAYDLTAPYAYLLERARLGRIAKLGLFHAQKVQYRQGIYLLEPYDPEQIPVLMVHGLVSSPLTWMELTNEIFGDPRLRDAYQVWHYIYPTGLPYLYSTYQLKTAIADLKQILDPERDDPAMRSMVVIAHSMGGLLTKTLVSSSGEAVWNTAFEVPPDELEVSTEDLAELREIFVFEPQPYIDRVLFLATPHRGSRLARSWLGRLGSRLVNLPNQFRHLFLRVARENPESVSPSMQRMLSQRGVTSIRALRPDHPIIRVTGEIPVDAAVPFHTILGDRGKEDGEEGSDGIVTYRSAHLAGATSELVVPAGHKLTGHPQTLAEVSRILKQHLETTSGSGPVKD